MIESNSCRWLPKQELQTLLRIALSDQQPTVKGAVAVHDCYTAAIWSGVAHLVSLDPLQFWFKGSVIFCSSVWRAFALRQFRSASRSEIFKLTSFYLKQVLFQVDGDWRHFLNLTFFFSPGNYLLVVALQHQWVVELSLRFIQLNPGMAKMVR